MTIRWMLAEHYPQPQATQVRLAELDSRLPAAVKRVTPAGRAAQIAARRRGVIQRWGM